MKMATVKIFAVRDNKVSSFLRPFAEQNEIMATRSLQIAINEPGIQLGMFPQDFDLYLLGEMDDINGHIIPEETPKFIISAISLKTMAEKAKKAFEKAQEERKENENV